MTQITMQYRDQPCRRLIAGGLPDTAGQPTQVQLHVTLDQLRDLPGAAAAEKSWAAARAAGDGTPGWVHSRAAAEGHACDAMTARYLAAGFRRPDCACGGGTGPPGPERSGAGPGGPPPLSPRTRRRLQNTLLAYAADILSGPAGLAAFLRTGLLANDFPASVSQPLDTGTPNAAVPPHLRRLVILRDRHCSFPGCRQKPAACQVHHLISRPRGGVTALHNLTLLCSFHHLIAVHRWGWILALNADGTSTATSPDHTRTYDSHGPPQEQAA